MPLPALLPLLQDAAPTIVPADTAWMLVSTALVLLMTPALAFFYGGLVRSKNALNTMMMSFVALGAVGIVWALVAYSLAFAEGNAWIGGLANMGLAGVGLEAKGTIPHLLFMAYQGTFAIITAALISGAVVERMRFGPYVAFIVLWTLLVYAPVAHWVWGGGWLMTKGVLDFAGGTVVHINAGVSALVAATVLGSRKDYGRQAILPHSVPFVLLGAGLLWFGWFGFNGGSALAAGELASLAFVNTFLAPMATLVVWVLLDYFRTGHATAVGGATGIVVGLVAITPAAGFISPLHAILLGAIATFPSYYAIAYRARTRLDDSLDVFAGHGVGGITGALLTGVFASKAWNSAGNDGLLAGNAGQLGLQAIGVATSVVYAGVMTLAILKLLGAVNALKAVPRSEGLGMDVTQHGEEAYGSGEGSILVLPAELATESVPGRAAIPQPASR
jgi:Amt family ammonium transporter